MAETEFLIERIVIGNGLKAKNGTELRDGIIFGSSVLFGNSESFFQIFLSLLTIKAQVKLPSTYLTVPI